ncbi:hypothetical protein F5X96DRAFT_614625 [Biscogniauxia mediterranea]|nr:hypothetical protein F5X96DRAFT_614625 [Biscogniauxia mediterranea]
MGRLIMMMVVAAAAAGRWTVGRERGRGRGAITGTTASSPGWASGRQRSRLCIPEAFSSRLLRFFLLPCIRL